MGLPAIVVDVGFVNGLSAIRSLGRAGVRVFAVDHRSSALGFRSRFATKVTAPNPLEDEEGFVEALLVLERVRRADVRRKPRAEAERARAVVDGEHLHARTPERPDRREPVDEAHVDDDGRRSHGSRA